MFAHVPVMMRGKDGIPLKQDILSVSYPLLYHIGGGTRGAGGAMAPPDFKTYAFGPTQISKPEINQH